MNDLAEKALDCLEVAYHQVRDRWLLSFAVAGFAVSVVVVVAGGAVGAAGSTRPLTSWLQLQNTSSPPAQNRPASWVMLGAIVALVLLWLGIVGRVRRNPQRVRPLCWVAAAWAAPFAVGPPLMDTSVYSYAAYGLLQRSGHNPYHVAPSFLGDAPAAAAVDPASRSTVSGVGPLGTVIQHLAASVGQGSALAAVIALRVLAVLVAMWIARLTVELGRDHPDRALTLAALNPLVLLYVVSAAHLDGLLVAFVLASLVTAKRRRWPVASAFAALAGSVSAPGFLVLALVVLAHADSWRKASTRERTYGHLARAIAGDVLPAAVVVCALGFGVPHGFGWVATVGKQFADHTPFSVAGGISAVLAPVVRGASFDDLAVGGRATVLIAMVCTLVYLAATARRRPIEQTAGFVLLAVGLLAPVLYPWYLLWGVLCLAPTASGVRRGWVLALVAGACVLDPPGFSGIVQNVVTGALLVVVAAVAGYGFVRHDRRDRRPPGAPHSPGTATTGTARTSANEYDPAESRLSAAG